MKAILITSKLEKANRRLLNYAADKNWERNNVEARAFTRVSRNTYVPIHNASQGSPHPSIHDVARSMMLTAHSTFSYVVVEIDNSRFNQYFVNQVVA